MMLLLIDALNLIRRIHAGVPGDTGSADHDEAVLDACTRSLQRALDQLEPTHALCAFDGGGTQWRHSLLPTYKSNRPAMDPGLCELLVRIEGAYAQLGVKSVQIAGYEADDVIATVACKLAARGGRCVVLSTDKSLLSLLAHGVRVRNHFEDRELDAQHTRERFGVEPEQLLDWLAMVGESSQSVPGVRGIGARTATRLLAEHGNLDGVLAAAPTLAGRTGSLLRDGEASARLSRQVLALALEVDVGVNLSDCRLRPAPRPDHEEEP